MPITELEKPRKQNCTQAAILGVLLLIMAVLLFFTRLGSYPLFNPDEALYAEPAREMLQTHDYLTTTLNYQTRFTKPPLCIWMEALSYKVFGESEFSARCFSAECAVSLVMTVFIFLLPYVGTWPAFLGASSLLSAPMFVAVGRMSITDMPLTLFVSGSLLCLFAAYDLVAGSLPAAEKLSASERAAAEKLPTEEKLPTAEYLPIASKLPTAKNLYSKWLVYVAYVLMGLAVMTKGPVGVVLPVVIVAIYHLLSKNWKQALKFYNPVVGIVIVAVISLPWYVAEIIATHGQYFNSFIVRENLQRYTQIVDAHHGAWWYHLVAVALGFFPWIVFIPQALMRAFSQTFLGTFLNAHASAHAGARSGAYSGAFSRVFPQAFQGISKRDMVNNELLIFSGLTSCFVVAFFSISVSKLLPYTLPAFPALACLLALEIDYIFEHKMWRRLVAPVAILLVGLSVAGLLLPQLFPKFRHVPLSLFTDAYTFLAFQVFITFVVLLLLLLPSAKQIAVIFLFLAEIGAFAYFGGETLSQLSRIWEGPIPTLSRMAAATGEPIFVYKMRKVSVPFYAGRATVLSPNQEFLTTTVEEELPKYPKACIIASVSDLKSFSGDSRFTQIKRLGYYVLIEWNRNKINGLNKFGYRSITERL